MYNWSYLYKDISTFRVQYHFLFESMIVSVRYRVYCHFLEILQIIKMVHLQTKSLIFFFFFFSPMFLYNCCFSKPFLLIQLPQFLKLNEIVVYVVCLNAYDQLVFVLMFLRPSQPNGVMSSAVSLPNHTFTGQALSSKRLTSIVHILSPEIWPVGKIHFH